MDNKKWANLILSVVIILCAGVVVVGAGSALTPKGLFVSDPVPSDTVVALAGKVKLQEYEIEKTEPRKVKTAFTIVNGSAQSLRNVIIACEFFDKQGKYLDREQWLLHGVVPAKKIMKHRLTSEIYIHSKAETQSCGITDFQMMESPLLAMNNPAGGHGAQDAHAGQGH